MWIATFATCVLLGLIMTGVTWTRKVVKKKSEVEYKFKDLLSWTLGTLLFAFIPLLAMTILYISPRVHFSTGL